MRARIIRLLLAVLLGGLAVSIPATAHADPLNLCSDTPAPVSPRSGMAGLLAGKPATVPPTTPDPFDDPKVPLGEVYGYHWSWANYDLGCGSDFLRDPVAVANTQAANWSAGTMAAWITLLASAEHLATDIPIDWAQQLVVEVTQSLRDLLLGGGGSVGWLPLAVLALAVFIGWRAKSADYAATARAVAVLGIAAALTVVALLFPQAASRGVDEGVRTITKITGASFNASLADTVHREAAYRTWLAGYFGDAESDLAQRLGSRLVAATHYSWTELDQIEQNPSSRARIDKTKAADFQAIAKEVEAQSPSSYETFTGRADRVGTALLGLVITLCMGLFAVIAFILIVIARIMMQALLIAAPISAVLGILPPGYVLLQKLWGLFTAGIVAVAKFTLAAGVMALVLGGLASADMAGAEQLVWILAATVAALILTRPARTIKTLIPGVDPHRSYLREILRKAGTMFATAKGVELGLKHDRATAPADTRVTAPVAAQPAVQPPLEALPAPEWQQIPPAPAQEQRRELPTVTDRTSPVIDTSRSWGGVLPQRQPSAPLELEPAPTRTVPDPPPEVLESPAADEHPGIPTPSTPTTPTPPDQRPTLLETPAPTPRAAEPSVQAGPGSSAAPGQSVDQVPVGQEGHDPAAVVYPSGVIVQTDQTLYSTEAGEEYVRLPEPEADELGQEQDVVLYSTSRGR